MLCSAQYEHLSNESSDNPAGSGASMYGDGPGPSAHFHNPQGVAVSEDGDIFVADTMNHRIRKISPSGEVTTLAGSGAAGFADGLGIAAQFYCPTSVAIIQKRWVVVADTNNHCIRMITPEGKVTTLACKVSQSTRCRGRSQWKHHPGHCIRLF